MKAFAKVRTTLLNSISKTSWFIHKKLNREFISTVNRIRANHYNLAASLFRNGICLILNADMAINLKTSIIYCRNAAYMIKLIKNLNKYELFLLLKVDIIIAKQDISACYCVYTFLED